MNRMISNGAQDLALVTEYGAKKGDIENDTPFFGAFLLS